MSSSRLINDTPMPGDLVDFNPTKDNHIRARFLIIARDVNPKYDNSVITLTTLMLATNLYPAKIVQICGSPRTKSGKRPGAGTYAEIAWYYGYDQKNIFIVRPT